MGKYSNASGAVGLVLLFFGILVLALTRQVSFFFLVHLIGGAALVSVYLTTRWQDFLRLFGEKASRHGTNAVVYSLLFLLLLILVNIVSVNHEGRIDITENKIHTLSEQSIQIAEGLERSVEILCFVNDESEEREALEKLLDMYVSVSDSISTRYIDPDKEPLESEKFDATHGIVLVKSGGKDTRTADISEEGITNAFKIILKEPTGTIYFLQGHGEMGGGVDEAGDIGLLREALANEGSVVKNLDSAANGIPEEAGTLVVAGPKKRLLDTEVESIRSFLESGGSCMLLLDPVITDERFESGYGLAESGLESLLAAWGVKPVDNCILERQMSLFAGSVIGTDIISSHYGDHKITGKLSGRNTIFYESRSLDLEEDLDDLEISPLIYSSGESSWGESNTNLLFGEQQAEYNDGEDEEGPLVIAAAVEKKLESQDEVSDAVATEPQPVQSTHGTARMVVFGDSDFASNQHVMNYYNADLFLDAFYWLSGEESYISILPRQMRSSTLLLTAGQMSLMFHVAVVAIPEIILILGLIATISRRSA